MKFNTKIDKRLLVQKDVSHNFDRNMSILESDDSATFGCNFYYVGASRDDIDNSGRILSILDVQLKFNMFVYVTFAYTVTYEVKVFLSILVSYVTNYLTNSRFNETNQHLNQPFTVKEVKSP